MQFSRPSEGVICSLPRWVKFPTWNFFGGAAAIYIPSIGQIMLGSDGSLLVAQLSAQTTSPKMPVRAIISRVPRPRVTTYWNPISHLTVPHEDNQIVTFHRIFAQIHFPVSNFFLFSSSPSTWYFNVMMTSHQLASSWSWRQISKINLRPANRI